MVWKTVVQSDAGTGTKFGGNDIDKAFSSFNGNNVSDPIIYNTDLNTLKNTTNAAGDILKGNGTKYVRLAMGTANQVLAVNAGGTDIAWTTGAGGGATNLDGLSDVAITSAARGDLIVRNATQFANFPKGTANQVLTMNSGATDPVWTTPITREDLCAFFSMARKTDIPSTYTDLEWLSLSPTGTQHVAGTTVYETSIDFTNKTQVKAQFILGRNGTGTQDVRIVDTGGTNVLFTSTGHTTDGRKTIALTSLPGWATGVSTIKIQMKSTVTTDDPSIVDMAVYLK